MLSLKRGPKLKYMQTHLVFFKKLQLNVDIWSQTLKLYFMILIFPSWLLNFCSGGIFSWPKLKSFQLISVSIIFKPEMEMIVKHDTHLNIGKYILLSWRKEQEILKLAAKFSNHDAGLTLAIKLSSLGRELPG